MFGIMGDTEGTEHMFGGGQMDVDALDAMFSGLDAKQRKAFMNAIIANSLGLDGQKFISDLRENIIRNGVASSKPEILDLHDKKCDVCRFNNAEILVVHHILPIQEGGSNSLENLSVLCPNCHAMLHQMNIG